MNATIVFIPGTLCDERIWAQQAAALSHRFLTPIVDIRTCRNLEEMLARIDQIPAGRFHLAGFSMGGYLAQLFALRAPERVESLALVAADTGPLSEKTRAFRARTIDLLSRAKFKGMNPNELQKYVHPDSLANPQVTETILAMSATYSSEQYIDQMRATIDRQDVSAELDALKLSTLIVAGEDDRVVRVEELKELHAQLSGSEFLSLPRCGHYVPLEKAEELTARLAQFF
jgi:pimeloyl-ACP methyl ester carboxylesterase